MVVDEHVLSEVLELDLVPIGVVHHPVAVAEQGGEVRESGNQVELGKLLCRRGLFELSLERPEAAAAALGEAHAIAARMGSIAGSELGTHIALLEAEVNA